MKLSTKIILPIILISALLILLNGCFGVPDDEEPGYTPGTITGTIAAPCCSTSDGPVTESSGPPEYWGYYTQVTWSLQDGVEVILTYGEDVIATTTTDENGEFTFTDVPPGKNYVITALCPDYDDDRPLVKDVALEVASTFDTKTTDIVSTSLGLVVDFLVEYTEWGPEDISLDEVIANGPNFYAFPKFKQLILEVRRVLESCENVDTDEDVQEALCLAAEEISGLDIGCAPGYTPPDSTPDPCEGNTAPNNVSLDNLSVVVGQTYSGTVSATDDGIKDPLTYSWTAGFTPPGDMTITSAGVITWNPGCEDICDCGQRPPDPNGGCTPNTIQVTVSDGCTTVDAEFCIEVINTPPKLFGANPQAIVDMVVAFGCDYTRPLVVLDPEVTAGYQSLTYNLVGNPASMSMDYSGAKPAIYWAPVCADVDGGPFSVTLEVSDDCETVSYPFTATATNDEPEIVSLAPITLDIGNEYTYEIVVEDDDVCPDGCQTLSFTLLEGPAGMVIDDAFDGPCEAQLTWTPECDDLTWEQVCTGGDCSDQYKSVVHVKIEVDDGCYDQYKEFDITVYSSNKPPMIIETHTFFNMPIPILDGTEYCFPLKAMDIDGDNLTWELIDTNAAGNVYFSDEHANSTTLCWESANCAPIMEKRTIGGQPPELCTRYFTVRVYDDGCPELYDEFCFDVSVRTSPLVAEQGFISDPDGSPSVRFKSFGNTGSREIYLGKHDLGVASNRFEMDYVWTNPSTYHVVFSYDSSSNTVLTSTGILTMTTSLTLGSGTCNPWEWNVLEVLVFNRDTGTTVNLNNLTIDGFPVDQDFTGATTDVWNTGRWLIPYDFGSDFIVEADLEIDGPFPSSSGDENSKVQFIVGCEP